MENNDMGKEPDNSLDDLIIKSNRSSGLKRLLLAAAILLLVLILIILITKNLIQSDQKPQPSVILPPEPTSIAKIPKKEPLFEQVPIEEEPSGAKKIDQVIKRVKNESQPIQKAKSEKIPAPTTSAEPAPAPAPNHIKSVKTPRKAATAKKSASHTATPGAKKETAIASGGYYIQAGAFFRYPPNKKFLHSIEKEGLHYVIAKGKKSGKSYKKVLIGPYSTKAAAQKDLDRVKKRINQNAYITYKK